MLCHPLAALSRSTMATPETAGLQLENIPHAPVTISDASLNMSCAMSSSPLRDLEDDAPFSIDGYEGIESSVGLFDQQASEAAAHKLGVGVWIRCRKRPDRPYILGMQDVPPEKDHHNPRLRRCIDEPSKRPYDGHLPHQQRRPNAAAREKTAHPLQHG